MIQNMKIEVLKHSGPTEEVNLIRRRLIEFNHLHSGGTDYRDLHLFLRDEHGKIRGGLLGWTVWSWFHIDSLWVDDTIRGEGWGTRLLGAGEEEAQERGCEISDVDTFTFQAKAFYEKAGYLRYGTLEGIGKGGIKRYYFHKSLKGEC
jgi:ribosomal protein S18 acetylase RimI-like enzyme